MIGWICCALALVFCAAVLVWRWRRERALFDRLDDMLDAAVEGRFHASDFDESQLSAFESRLAQYLQAGADSSLRLAEQRDQIAGLVSDVSHQTKTPVANIRLYSQLLAEEPLSAQGAECAAVIAAQAEILALHPRETVLAPLVRSAASQYAAKAEAAGVALSLGETAGCAVCDPKWTEEALCNILDNAIKYTPVGGNVQLDVVCYPMFCALRVRDDGPGIAESEQAKIFARFYRAPNAYDKPGVGIGLYLARQIAQGQGGYIKCTSAPGKGSTFALYLPAAALSGKENESC